MKTACVILNYNDSSNTLKLALKVSTFENIDYVVIVDNCSTDDSMDQFEPYITGKIHCIKTDKNGGYGYGNNFGAKFSFNVLGAEAAIISNPDVMFEQLMVEKLKRVLVNDHLVGIVSAIQLDATGKEVAMSAWRIPRKWSYIFSVDRLLKHILPGFGYTREELHRDSFVRVECVAGSLLLISQRAFEATGGYDEDMFLYCEETTLGCKMQRCGLKTYLCSDVCYYHLHSVSINKSIRSNVEKCKIMLSSHHLLLKRYLGANRFELTVDKLICKICLFEEEAKTALCKFINK